MELRNSPDSPGLQENNQARVPCMATRAWEKVVCPLFAEASTHSRPGRGDHIHVQRLQSTADADGGGSPGQGLRAHREGQELGHGCTVEGGGICRAADEAGICRACICCITRLLK
jgi:hypothetical protein